ncbi:MAG: ATP-binding protein, partial [Candidatus Eremiobacterota bacterium]
EALASPRLLKTREPLVESAFSRSGDPVQGTPGPLFPGEAVAVAVGVEELGTLYVGRAEAEPFGRRELHLLTVVAAQAGTALKSSRWMEAQQQELRHHAQAHTALQDWVQGLDTLLEASRSLASSLDPTAALDRLEEALQQLVPSERRVVVLLGAGDSPIRTVRDSLPSQDEAVLAEIIWAVIHNQRPLLIEDLRTSRFFGVSGEHLSLLAAPMTTERGPVGALVLTSERGAAFSRQAMHLVAILGYQAAVALNNAELHAQTIAAYDRLRTSQAELVESRKMGAVGQLAAGVAHEVNTPLCAALLSVDRALLGRDPERTASVLNDARQDILRAQEIVEKLLFYARDARSGRIRMDLDPLVEDTLLLVKSRLEQSGIRLEYVPGRPPPVLANQGELQQVLLNLLDNAAEAVAGADVREIRVATSQEGGRAVVTVTDTGPGVDPAVADRIFEPFFSTRPLGQSAGLGLAVSQQLVRGHDGLLTFRSHPGETVFRLELPGTPD